MWMHMMRAGEEFIKDRMLAQLPEQSVSEAESARLVN